MLLLFDCVAGWWWWQRRREHRFDAEILQAARRYGMDPALIKAVVWRESRFREDAQGTAGEIGLMQIRPAAAQEWTAAEHVLGFQVEHLRHPGTNLLAGAWYLKKLMSRYPRVDDPLPYALADYNAGRTHSLRWGQGLAATNSAQFVGNIGFPATQLYLQEVLQRRARYQVEFAPPR
jgi:soluble lytic murein transglycosylase